MFVLSGILLLLLLIHLNTLNFIKKSSLWRVHYGGVPQQIKLTSLMPYAFLNKKVFSCLLKTDSVRLMSRSPRGSEFQKDGPETANIPEPYPRVLVRGMTKSPRAVDRSDRRPETSAAAVSISNR